MFLIKENGKITKVQLKASFEAIKRIVGKPNLCASCGVCGCFRNIENDAITLAAKAQDGLYVGACDNYEAVPKLEPIVPEKTQHDGNNTATLMHPNVRHTFIR